MRCYWLVTLMPPLVASLRVCLIDGPEGLARPSWVKRMSDDREDRTENERHDQLQPFRNSADSEEEDESIPIPQDILERMEPQDRSIITRAFSSITQVGGPVFNPVLRRITSEHITQIIHNSEAQSNRDAEADKANRRYQFAYFVLGLTALIFLLVFFTIREQYNVLAAVITGAMGFGSGFGVGKFTGRR